MMHSTINMTSLKFTIIFAIIIIFLTKSKVFCKSGSCKGSSEGNQTVEYYVVAKSYVSKQKVIAKKNVKVLEDCKLLARKKKGMAFSYRSTLESKKKPTKDKESCIVYDCPEMENSTSLVENKDYDYYSIFADPIPPQNATCIPHLGVFVVHLHPLNYSQARSSCKRYGSTLPDVASERRTSALAELIELVFPRGRRKEVYVGLENMDGTSFIRSNGEKLECSLFRAWAPGNPKRLNQSCGLLTADKMWKTVDCRAKRPFVCEIYPGGWDLIYYDYFAYYYYYSYEYYL